MCEIYYYIIIIIIIIIIRIVHTDLMYVIGGNNKGFHVQQYNPSTSEWKCHDTAIGVFVSVYKFFCI